MPRYSSQNRLPGWVILMGALTAVGPLSIDMYLPSFPAITHDLPGAVHVELTLAAFFIGVASGQLFYGPVSDRFGRKPPLHVGLALFALASLGAAQASSMEALVAWRFLQGLGGCAGMVIARAVVRDRCTPVEVARTFSLLMQVMGLAPILAPMLGGLLLKFAVWRALFAALALFAVVCWFFVWKTLTESLPSHDAEPLHLGRVLRHYLALLRHRPFMACTLSSGLASSGMFAYIAGSPFVVMELHGLTPQQYGWMFGANAFGIIAASRLNMLLLRRYSMMALLRTGLLVAALTGSLLVLLLLFKLLSLPLLLAGFFIFIFSMGLISPNGGAIALADQRAQAGTASALMGTLQFTLATLAGASLSVWHDGTALPLLTVMACCGVGACLLLPLVLGKQAPALPDS
ncbi:MAG: Bcr/CflA family multidrug efflux MFS transporter [Gallionellaceae bacterium]|jgi:DHA1 family bicyclomycin/chloramphenicol resistance-like MFS transporter|nr:Bcr/CflA family multidrug efflux MFS transporter [Gallionellaceae bacterium]